MAGSPPKRRRTDNGPVTSEDIAQANSTLHIFTGAGQRQNRWMQDQFNAHTTENNPTTTTPTVNGIGERRTSSFTGGFHVPNPNAEGATRAEPQAFPPSIVEYESPTTRTNVSTTSADAFTKRINVAPNARAQPALPSPALSDEHIRSPISGAPRLANQTSRNNQSALHPMRGRPQSMDHGRPLAVVTGHTGHAVLQRPVQYSAAQHPGFPASHPNANSAMRVQSMPQVPPQTSFNPVPLQLYPPPLQSGHQPQNEDSIFSPPALFQSFQSSPRENLNNVDSGRLTLLKEAIDKGDLFYIALSQIHALTKEPDSIPEPALRLHPDCFQYLDRLLCTTNIISDHVIGFLQTFPAKMVRIYSSKPNVAIYEPLVQKVVEFLRILPHVWNNLMGKSQRRESPPLVEDLFHDLHLPSPVFQNTVFRAIARSVLPLNVFTYPEKAIDRFEVLHKLDAMWFVQNGRRSREQKLLAYRAFRITKRAWQLHENQIAQSSQQSSARPPDFSFPMEALAAFQQRAYPIPPSPTNGMQFNAAAQQQQVPTQMTLPPHAVAPPPPRSLATTQYVALMQARQSAGTPPQPLASRGFVFPREDEMPRPQPTDPDPKRSALHQAHLRSPKLHSAQATRDSPHLYRHIVGFALSPVKLFKDEGIQDITFNVPQADFEKIPKTIPSLHPGEPPTRHLTEMSHTYRLRCAYHPPSGFPNESAWVVADNYWPEALFLEFNGTILELRRKLHHNRYLPIDLTGHIRVGENTIRVIVNRMSTDTRPFDFVVAVEVVGVISQTSIRTQIQTMGSEQALDAIKTSLSSGNDDDELFVISSKLTIKLFDPHSQTKIFDVPVRGAACAHRDCFDLETFLSMCKRDDPRWPSVVDCWRCPICRGDVRPQTLVIDGFLVEVRKELEQLKLLNTRAIVVDADGSWVLKIEERTGVRSPSLEREERGRREKSVSASATKKKQLEVVMID